MQLFLTIPEAEKIFRSADYTLKSGYSIVQCEEEQKKLQGRVQVNSLCPFCKTLHGFSSKEVTY